jgi:tetratricopeptide (TPR) repeat protein
VTAIFDCHDEAYYHWRDAGVRGATLIHVDAHHDLEEGPASGVIHVGNYVRAAIQAEMVSRMTWVLPHPMWANRTVRARAIADLEALRLGIPATVAPMADAPAAARPVLLDVDLDYLFTVGFNLDPAVATLGDPWCAVETLAEAIDARWPSRGIVTIATSLTGAFTPLRWKHLARALGAALDGTPLADGWDAAARDFQEAERLGNTAEARSAFARAAAADPEYRHAFRTPGHVYRRHGRTADAEQAFHAALHLDPEDPWARLGLAMTALDDGQAASALSWLGETDPFDTRIDAWRTRARARAALGDLDGAVAAGTRTLALALDGGVPLSVWTSNRDRRLVDPDHAHDHARLSSWYRRAGDLAAADAHRRIAQAGGVAVEEHA